MIDLHIHLDGSLTAEELLVLARTEGIRLPAETPEGLRPFLTVPSGCGSLNDYLRCFETPLAVLQSPEAVEYAAASLAGRLREQGLLYAEIRPTVSFPHLPENTKTIDECRTAGENGGPVRIDPVVIGSCTNGRMEDMRAAAEILKDRKVADGVRCIIIPATQEIWRQSMHEGLFDIFVEAGAVVSTTTCGPCLGGHMGILAAGERAVSTTNRNFVGRMGHVDSEVYLASPYVAAASAVAGVIADPASL